ncbi:MAG: hypothetical protein ACLQVK_00880 [Acidimicrobiales bacterium]
MTGLLGAFFAQVAIITYRAVSGGGVSTPTQAPLPLPLPAEYTAAALIYGALAIAPASLAPIPGLIGWGLVVANLLKLPIAPGVGKPIAKAPAGGYKGSTSQVPLPKAPTFAPGITSKLTA